MLICAIVSGLLLNRYVDHWCGLLTFSEVEPRESNLISRADCFDGSFLWRYCLSVSGTEVIALMGLWSPANHRTHNRSRRDIESYGEGKTEF